MTELSELLDQRFGLGERAEIPERGEETVKAVLGHRTFRHYSKSPVSDELLELLLSCALSAPAKSDLMQFSIVHVSDPEKKRRLSVLSNTAWMATAPVILIFCGDTARNRRITQARGYEYMQNTLDSFMNAAVDAALAMQNFTVAAEAVGLGCCYVSQIRLHLDEVADLFHLPEGVFPVAGLTAGWPGEERDMTLRLPKAATVHRNAYQTADLDEVMAGYDARRNERRPTPPEKQMYTDQYGVSEDYGWSENTARRLSRSDGLSSMRVYLEGKGFDLV